MCGEDCAICDEVAWRGAWEAARRDLYAAKTRAEYVAAARQIWRVWIVTRAELLERWRDTRVEHDVHQMMRERSEDLPGQFVIEVKDDAGRWHPRWTMLMGSAR
jgi:hypothetical protein